MERVNNTGDRGGALQAIESALEPPAVDKDGHLIHTPNGPRVAHVSHLPVQVT